MAPPSLRRLEWHAPGAGGTPLLRRAWIPPSTELAVVLVHGYAEHSGRYEELATWLAERGCAVYAYDHRGHGLSHGARGHVGCFTDYLDDLEGVLEGVAAEHPALPRVVVGHSMGGLVVAALACERSPQIAAAVLSGPALAVAEPPSALLRSVVRVARRVAPRARRRGPVDPDLLSRDPEVGRAYLADPLIFSTMTLSLSAELLAAVERTASAAAAVTVPMLILHGGDDRLCLPSGSRRFYEGLRVAECDLQIYPGLRHEIFQEPERFEIFRDALDWMRKTCTPQERRI